MAKTREPAGGTAGSWDAATNLDASTREYAPKAQALIKASGGRILAAGQNVASIEGAPRTVAITRSRLPQCSQANRSIAHARRMREPAFCKIDLESDRRTSPPLTASARAGGGPASWRHLRRASPSTEPSGALTAAGPRSSSASSSCRTTEWTSRRTPELSSTSARSTRESASSPPSSSPTAGSWPGRALQRRAGRKARSPHGGEAPVLRPDHRGRRAGRADGGHLLGARGTSRRSWSSGRVWAARREPRPGSTTSRVSPRASVALSSPRE